MATQHLQQLAHGLLSNAATRTCSPPVNFRCELLSSSNIQGMGNSFPGSAASPLLLQEICLFCRSHWKSFTHQLEKLQPTNMRVTIRELAQLCSPRYFTASCTAGLLTHETKMIYTTSLTLQAPDTHD